MRVRSFLIALCQPLCSLQTSSHAFRSSNDMQFAFSYFYYLINERQTNVWPRLLNTLVDTNHNGGAFADSS